MRTIYGIMTVAALALAAPAEAYYIGAPDA